MSHANATYTFILYRIPSITSSEFTVIESHIYYRHYFCITCEKKEQIIDSSLLIFILIHVDNAKYYFQKNDELSSERRRYVTYEKNRESICEMKRKVYHEMSNSTSSQYY